THSTASDRRPAARRTSSGARPGADLSIFEVRRVALLSAYGARRRITRRVSLDESVQEAAQRPRAKRAKARRRVRSGPLGYPPAPERRDRALPQTPCARLRSRLAATGRLSRAHAGRGEVEDFGRLSRRGEAGARLARLLRRESRRVDRLSWRSRGPYGRRRRA